MGWFLWRRLWPIGVTIRPDSALARLSPDYNDQEIRRIWEGNDFATPYLLPELVALDLTTIHKLGVPLILFEGRHDRNVNSEVAAAWFETVDAPEKASCLVRAFSAHTDDRRAGKFFLSLMRFAGRSPKSRETLNNDGPACERNLLVVYHK